MQTGSIVIRLCFGLVVTLVFFWLRNKKRKGSSMNMQMSISSSNNRSLVMSPT